MTRSINASVVTELAKDDFNMVDLLYFGFDTPIYITTASHDVDTGTLYASSPHTLNLGNVQEHADLRVGTFNITLSGVEQTYVSLFLSDDYMDVRVTYHKALLDDSGAVIGQPILMFDGRISGVKGGDNGESSTLIVECASHWANFDTINGRMSNDASQQSVFSGDTGATLTGHSARDVKWGQK